MHCRALPHKWLTAISHECRTVARPAAPGQCRDSVMPLPACDAPWRAGARPRSGATCSSSYCERECSVEGWRRPLGGSARTQPAVPMVALGKFDAMHRGHQALAAAAARLGGTPWLVSFAGMADVLGWPSRLPLVAPCDRRRVLETWTGGCGGATPAECAIPFAEVRTLSPEEFVRLLAEELRVGGVAVGSNFRFGYKAAGTAALMQQLGPAYGLKVAVVGLVGGQDPGAAAAGQAAVSSSRIRDVLAAGDVQAAAECLGRPYRLIVDVPPPACGEDAPRADTSSSSSSSSSNSDGDGSAAVRAAALCLPAAAFDNQAPGPGRTYRVQAQSLASGWEMRHVGQGIAGEVHLHEDGIELPGQLAELAVPGSKLVLDFV